MDQYNEYKWFSLDELLQSKAVHKYVKNYFAKDTHSNN
jgi:hypothetical protein